MKKNKIAYLVIGGIIGTLLFSSISALAISKLYADSVSINTKNIDTLQEGATLQDALDDLYNLTSGKYFTNEDAQKLINQVNELKNNQMSADSVLNKIYPVGSIYVSTTLKTAAEVKSAIGGTWESYGDGKVLRGTTGTSGQTGGASTVSLATTNLPSHNHSISSLSGSAESNGAHKHTVTASGSVSSTFTGSSATTSSSGSHTHSIPSLSGATDENTLTGNIAMHNAGSYTNVYTATGVFSAASINSNAYQKPPGYNTGAYSIGDIAFKAKHTHSITTNASTTGSSGSHTHTVTASGSVSSTFTGSSATTSSSGSHTHSITTNASTTGSKGSGTAFSVLDPYITVYMYKRTA